MADGRVIMYAGAGILYGLVTLGHGLRLWRQMHPAHAHTSKVQRLRLLAKSEIPLSMTTGAGVALACTVYLIWVLL
jgi:hypothetical protein